MRQAGQAAVPQVPQPGAAQGGERLLLTGLLQGQPRAVQRASATQGPLHALLTMSSCCLLLVPHSHAGSVGRAQEGAPEAGVRWLDVCHQAGSWPRQGNAIVQLHWRAAAAPCQPNQRGVLGIPVDMTPCALVASRGMYGRIQCDHHLQVPESIPRPEYAASGEPINEMRSRAQNSGEVQLSMKPGSSTCAA